MPPSPERLARCETRFGHCMRRSAVLPMSIFSMQTEFTATILFTTLGSFSLLYAFLRSSGFVSAMSYGGCRVIPSV